MIYRQAQSISYCSSPGLQKYFKNKYKLKY